MSKHDKAKNRQIDQTTQELLDRFCEAYQIQKGVDLDRVELCVHEESNGKRAVFYFRVCKTPRPVQIDFN